MEFWKLLALYVSSNLLGSVSWAFSFGEEERKTMEQQAKDVSVWYDNMNRLIPSWYQKYHRE
jgi:aminoglycoside phosphotransferase (APT) family kinase protein